jgi:hypothetical protein
MAGFFVSFSRGFCLVLVFVLLNRTGRDMIALWVTCELLFCFIGLLAGRVLCCSFPHNGLFFCAQ